MKKSILLSAVASLGLAVASSQGAVTLSHTLTITNVYTTAGAVVQNNPTAAQLTTDESSGTTMIYRVAINSSMGGLPSGQAYGDELFNLTPTSGLTRVSASTGSARPNYVPTSTSDGFDNNGTAVPTLQKNADAGPSATDLQAITVVINNDPNSYNNVFDDANDDNQITDNRPSFANPGPTKVGTIDFVYSGNGAPAWLTLGGSQFATLDIASQTFGSTVFVPDGSLGSDPTSGSASVLFGAVPEPTTLSLLGLGAMGLIARRRKA